jgi:prepilin signal peptidase PulO-like enzyme (type II secretory pathway)
MNIVIIACFVLFSLPSLVVDIKNYHVRTKEITIGTALILIIKLIFHLGPLSDTMAGAIAGYGSFWVICKLTRGRLGAGDVWYSGFIGVSFGFWVWDIAILIATILGMCYIIIRKLLKKELLVKEIKIPFAPFMFVGALAGSLCRSVL